MSVPGVAVVGTGFIGPVHVEALRRLGMAVVGVLGSDPDKSRRAAAALGLDAAYRDLDELLADPRVGSVHVASPNRLHFEQASRALAAGKHVLCEKPLAMTSAESAELVRLAAGKPLATGVNYNVRFYALCRELADRVRSGTLGEVWHVTGSYAQDWLFHPTDFNWRVRADEGGPLRAVADIGTHWLDLAFAVTGLEVEAVCAELRTVHPRRSAPAGGAQTFTGGGAAPAATESVAVDTEDYGCLLLRFRGGARGCVWVSQVTAGRKNCLRLEVAGSRGSAAWDSTRSDELWLGRRDGPNELLVRDPALLGPLGRGSTSYPGEHAEGFPDSFKHCFRAFYDYIATGDFAAPPPFPTFADGHRELLLCDAVLRSHREGGLVAVGGSAAPPGVGL
jgi:predicted dehydrogenase